MNKLGIAVIGYGSMGERHAENVLKNDNTRLCGVFDLDKSKRSIIEGRGIHFFETLEEIMESDAEACIVSTPNNSHCDITCSMLGAGKHVIVDKPAAMNLEDLDKMIATANQKGRVLTVYQNRRWDSDFLNIKKAIDDGCLGELFNLESRIYGSRGIPSDWRRTKQAGGGMLYDWGVHLVDQVMTVFNSDEVEAVSCFFSDYSDCGVDDGFYLTICLKGKKRVFVEVNTHNFIALPRFYAVGKEGTARITDWRQECSVVQCTKWDEKTITLKDGTVREPRTMEDRDENTIRTFNLPYQKGDANEFFDNFCSVARGEGELLVPMSQVRTVLKIIMMAMKSGDNKGALVAWGDIN